MEYAIIKKSGPVHFAHLAPLSSDVVRLRASVTVQNFRTSWNDTIVDFYADMLLTGTEKRSKAEIEAYLKKYGLTLSVTAQKDMLHFTIVSERSVFKKALALLEELIFMPAFSASEFKLRKQTLLEENRESHDDAKLITEINFHRALYPKTSLFCMQTLNDERTVLSGITIASLKKLKASVLSGEWYISLLGGDISLKETNALVTKLEKTARSVEIPDSITKTLTRTGVFETVTGKTNVEVRIGNILPITGKDDDYIPFVFGLNVLGKVGGFSGRLMSIVREKEGLTYGIYARTNYVTNTNTGHWNIFTFFTAKDLEQGIASTTREIRSIVAHGITDAELVIFKEILKNQFLIGHGSDSGRIMFYHRMLMDHETSADVANDMEKIAQLTKAQVDASLKKYIDPENLVISGAGPVTKAGKGILAH